MLKWICLFLFVTITSGHYHHSFNERIRNGTEANNNNRFPWMAVITSRVFNFNTKKYDHQFSISCSGTIISKRFIITTMTCLYDLTIGNCSTCFLHARPKEISKMRVYVGKWNLADRGEPVAIKRLIPHQKFNNCTKENDIALLELKKELHFNHPGLKSMRLANSHWIQVGQRATVAGWGPRCNNGTLEERLRLSYLIVNIRKKSQCHPVLTLNKPEDTYLCAGSQYGALVELGDFGGGLWIEENNVPLLIGVASAIQSPCINPFNAVFTNLYNYRKWILKNTNRRQ